MYSPVSVLSENFFNTYLNFRTISVQIKSYFLNKFDMTTPQILKILNIPIFHSLKLKSSPLGWLGVVLFGFGAALQDYWNHSLINGYLMGHNLWGHKPFFKLMVSRSLQFMQLLWQKNAPNQSFMFWKHKTTQIRTETIRNFFEFSSKLSIKITFISIWPHLPPNFKISAWR
jgi:hypothetical protein